MITEPSVLQLTGSDGTAEFRADPAESTFKLTVGKETRRFKFIDLYALTFAMATPEQQADLMPVRKTEVLTYRRVHNIMLKKDMKKGETLRCKCEINVEKQVVEALGGIIKKQISMPSGGVPIIGRK